MTYRDISERLAHAGIENAAGEARLLIEHFTSVPLFALRADPCLSIPDPDGALEDALTRRLTREPLQYILGTWAFRRLEFEISPDCLVPRADTECLVEQALSLLPHGGRVLDLCTGSGCIAIALLDERPDATAVAVEYVAATLALAQRNAVRNGVHERLCLLGGDVLDPNFLNEIGRFDLIVSNPPYIPTSVLPSLPPETLREPLVALDGGEDGLLFYRRMLAPDYRALLTDGGRFCFEIGYDQADALRALAQHCSLPCAIYPDLGGNDRVAVIG